MGKLGLIAGAGGLPVEVAAACHGLGRPVFVVRLKGLADPSLDPLKGQDIGLTELGRCIGALRHAGCTAVCLAGQVKRPDFTKIKPDLLALKHLPRLASAAQRGDDALLSAVLGVFETEGFEIESAGEPAFGIALGPGPLGEIDPYPNHDADIRRAIDAAREAGRSGQGQGAIVRDGEVIAAESWDGTDAMLLRCADPNRLAGERRGVLAKVPKPAQDRRVDLPTIGVTTIELAAEAGLAGVVGEAGGMLVVGREAVREAADRLGLFVFGVEAGTS
jgi:DUF1009 family protein